MPLSESFLSFHFLRKPKVQILCAAVAVGLAVGLAAPALAEDEKLTNEFGNFVFPDHVFSTPGGLNPRRDTGDTSGNGTRRRIELNKAKNTRDVVFKLLEALDAEDRFDEEPDQIFNAQLLLEALDVKIDNASGANQPFNFNSFTGGSLSVNRRPVSLSNVLRDLATIDQQTTDAAAAAIMALADTDPFVAFQGSFTNRSETDTISVFLPFEQAFFEPIPIDSGLSRQILIELEANDTNGDGTASIQEGRIEYFIAGANNITGPDVNSTRNLGAVDSLGLSRINERFENGRQRIGSVGLVNAGDRDRFSDEAGLTHMFGQVVLRDISPGDTIDFTAIVSLGVPGDPSLPLLPVDALATIFTANEVLANDLVPEPTGLILVGGLIGMLGRRRRVAF